MRAHPNRFFLVAGHEDAEAAHERIVEAEQGYAAVEKVGTAGVEAERLDPRHHAGTMRMASLPGVWVVASAVSASDAWVRW